MSWSFPGRPAPVDFPGCGHEDLLPVLHLKTYIRDQLFSAFCFLLPLQAPAMLYSVVVHTTFSPAPRARWARFSKTACANRHFLVMKSSAHFSDLPFSLNGTPTVLSFSGRHLFLAIGERTPSSSGLWHFFIFPRPSFFSSLASSPKHHTLFSR